MTYNDIQQSLIKYGLLNNNKLIRNIEQVLLLQYPDLLQHIITNTSFLLYNASIKERVICILQNIIQQPKCKHCNNILHMRIKGRFRYTFGEFCSTECRNQYRNEKLNNQPGKDISLDYIKNILRNPQWSQSKEGIECIPYVIQHTNFLPKTASLPQRSWHIKNNILNVMRCKCGTKLHWCESAFKYYTYCSRECVATYKK